MKGEPVRGGLPDPGFSSLAGIDQAQARRRGLIPRSPLEHLTGMWLTQVSSGSVTVRTPTSPWFQIAEGTLDFLMTAEAALSLAVLTGAPAASDVRIVALSVTQFRPWTLDSDSLIARAHIVAGGATFTFAAAALEDGLGRSVAHAAGTAVVRPMDPPPPAAGPPTRTAEAPRYPTPDPYLRPLPAEATPMPREQRERLTGVDIFRVMEVGEIPPYPLFALLGIRLESIEPGHATWRIPASEWFCSRNRMVPPGVLASAGHCSLISALLGMSSAGQRIGIVGETLNFLRPLPADGQDVVLEATVTERHGELMAASLAITSGERVATGHATGMCIPMRRRPAPAARTVLATVVFTDIVASTARAAALGDERWAQLHLAHDDLIRRTLRKCNGREIKSTGDGFLLTFATPVDAVAFAGAVRHEVRGMDLEIRVGIHTGQCDEVDGDISGIAVHLASRVLAAAEAGEVLATSTVRDLLLGADVAFVDRGDHELKGLDGGWHLFALSDHG
jgi:class 3 adenylate cyclase